MAGSKKQAVVTTNELESQLEDLRQQLGQAREAERRALADYQNVVRRQQQDRSQLVRMAAREVVERLLEPLGHLNLAASQLGDQGLTMVVERFWTQLSEVGLEEVTVMGQPFDVTTMEVADKEGSGEVVVKVLRPCYRLNGDVIQHARVVMGDK